MISYIFKNKTKNILAIIFSALCIVKPLCEFLVYIARYRVFPWFSVLNVLPVALVLMYLLTLKYNYKLKTYIVPAAFLIWIVAQLYVTFADITSAFSYLKMFEQYPMAIAFMVIDTIVLICGKFFCFLGSIYNFKNISLFKIGIIINLVAIAVLAPIVETFSAVEYFGATNIFFENLRQLLSDGVIFGRVANMLFYVGLLLLAFSKKSENIDITPYIEERKAKKDAKIKARLQEKAAEQAEYDAPPPETPQGFWRCMACGKILENDTQRCECGYKR